MVRAMTILVLYAYALEAVAGWDLGTSFKTEGRAEMGKSYNIP
jgi:hypothetical protein